MKTYYKKNLQIDYNEIIKNIQDLDYNSIISHIIPILEKLWIDKYTLVCEEACTIVKYPTNTKQDSNFNYYCLFDEASSNYEVDILSEKFVEDRTICSYGISSIKTCDRKKNDFFMKESEKRKWSDDTDRGHYIAHARGGSVYGNIFPQKKELNRAISKEGKEFRKIENFLKNNQGIFCFSRPIYFDFTYRPFLLEYGYLDKNLKWMVKVFENV